MATKFSKAGERVSINEDDFDGVNQVLAGKSRWQDFISPNVAPALKKYPGHTFNIVSAQVFGQTGGLDSETMAFTDKVNAKIVFVEIFKGEAQTMVFAALHEMVHWVSHPTDQGKRITAWGALGDGLGEGLTQVITEDIFDGQGIAQYYKPVYADRASIVRKLIERFDISPFGEALFKGRPQALQPLLDTYGSGLQKIKGLASANNSKEAIGVIDDLNRAFDAKPKKGAPPKSR